MAHEHFFPVIEPYASGTLATGCSDPSHCANRQSATDLNSAGLTYASAAASAQRSTARDVSLLAMLSIEQPMLLHHGLRRE